MNSEIINKPVAVLNKNIEIGSLMNALSHMCFGLGNIISDEEAKLTNYVDADTNIHPNISELPFIVLKTNSNKIRKLRENAIEHKIKFVDFIDTMTIGTDKEQLDKTSKTLEKDLIYSGIVLSGEQEQVSSLTKKFSLFKF